MIACMGGWCSRREKCSHYWAVSRTTTERLCIKGRDGVRQIEATPVRVIHIDVFSGQEIESDELEASR